MKNNYNLFTADTEELANIVLKAKKWNDVLDELLELVERADLLEDWYDVEDDDDISDIICSTEEFLDVELWGDKRKLEMWMIK